MLQAQRDRIQVLRNRCAEPRTGGSGIRASGAAAWRIIPVVHRVLPRPAIVVRGAGSAGDEARIPPSWVDREPLADLPRLRPRGPGPGASRTGASGPRGRGSLPEP